MENADLVADPLPIHGAQQNSGGGMRILTWRTTVASALKQACYCSKLLDAR